jgi:hypothetical protein
VDLPHIQVIGLQTGQRFFEHAHGDVFLPSVGADLGHHDRFVAFALERGT